jgi:uncharacterized membrane protein
MIALHVFDSFVDEATRRSLYGDVTYYFGGGAAPMFLALAGLATTLAIGKGYAAMIRRGVEIWLLALLFRIQEWALGGDGSFSGMVLRVDVLNCIGLAILLAIAVHAFGKRLGSPGIALLVFGLLIVGTTPLVARAEWLAAVPAPLRHHLGGPPAYALFPLFPWAGVALLGAALGCVPSERLMPATRALFFGYFGIVILRVLFKDPLAFRRSNIHPVFTLERTALSLGLVWVAASYLKRAQVAASTFVLLGRRSLLIYWVHVELCYGLLLHRYKHSLDGGSTLALTVAMILFSWALAYWLPKLKRS